MAKLRHSNFRSKITFLKREVVFDDDYGKRHGKYAPILERVWAQVLDTLPSKDLSIQSGIVTNNRTAKIRLRYRQGIDVDMRIVIHGKPDRLMKIIGGPAVVGNKSEIELMVQEIGNE